jgi:hypothetical protein
MADLNRNMAVIYWNKREFKEAMERFEEEHAVLLNVQGADPKRIEEAKQWAETARAEMGG